MKLLLYSIFFDRCPNKSENEKHQYRSCIFFQYYLICCSSWNLFDTIVAAGGGEGGF